LDFVSTDGFFSDLGSTLQEMMSKNVKGKNLFMKKIR
jgi:hypothetical protein